ncbi:hypothetical protein [Micromonospora palomenae]|nr:hypothetical protein [Micromonospora palomenae]
MTRRISPFSASPPIRVDTRRAAPPPGPADESFFPADDATAARLRAAG